MPTPTRLVLSVSDGCSFSCPKLPTCSLVRLVPPRYTVSVRMSSLLPLLVETKFEPGRPASATFSVPPCTASVPATVVLPVAAVTLNLFVFTARSPVTPRVVDSVVAPLTASVPPTAVLPLAAVTLNLFVFTDTDPPMSSELESVVAPVTPSVPPTLVLPLAAGTLNLLVLTATSPLAASVPTLALPLLSVPPSVVLPAWSIVSFGTAFTLSEARLPLYPEAVVR